MANCRQTKVGIVVEFCRLDGRPGLRFLVSDYRIGFTPTIDMFLRVLTYIGVDSIAEGLARAESHSCTVASGIEDVGEEIQITHLVSPTGDRFGLIVNPYFKVDSN